MRQIIWLTAAEEDRQHWLTTDPRVTARLETLVLAIRNDPFKGIGKPEPLKGPLAGWWSRRITREHRLIYRVKKGTVWILQARYHY